MAIAVKSIPVLKDKVAAAFIADAEFNYTKKKASVDFSKQVAKVEKILAQAKL